MEETGKTRKAKQNVFQNLVRYQIFLVIGVKMELKLGGQVERLRKKKLHSQNPRHSQVTPQASCDGTLQDVFLGKIRLRKTFFFTTFESSTVNFSSWIFIEFFYSLNSSVYSLITQVLQFSCLLSIGFQIMILSTPKASDLYQN